MVDTCAGFPSVRGRSCLGMCDLTGPFGWVQGQGSRRHAKVDVVTVAIGGGLGANAAAPAREDEVHG